MDLSTPGTRRAIFAIVLVALAIAGVGLCASRQPSTLGPSCATAAVEQTTSTAALPFLGA